MEIVIKKTDLISAIIISKSLSIRDHQEQIYYLDNYFKKKKVFVALEEITEFWTAKKFADLLYAKDDLCEAVTEEPSSKEVKVYLSKDVIEILNWMKLC